MSLEYWRTASRVSSSISLKVQFTFTRKDARALKASVMALRGTRADVRGVIRHDSFVYAANKDVPAPSVCGHL